MPKLPLAHITDAHTYPKLFTFSGTLSCAGAPTHMRVCVYRAPTNSRVCVSRCVRVCACVRALVTAHTRTRANTHTLTLENPVLPVSSHRSSWPCRRLNSRVLQHERNRIHTPSPPTPPFEPNRSEIEFTTVCCADISRVSGSSVSVCVCVWVYQSVIVYAM